MVLPIPQLAAKWNVGQQDLSDAFDFLRAYHLGFVVRVLERHMTKESPDDVQLMPVSDDIRDKSKGFALTPGVVVLILTLLTRFAKPLAHIVELLLGTTIPQKPVTTTSAQSVVTALATATVLAILLTFGGLSFAKTGHPAPLAAGQCQCCDGPGCICKPGECQCPGCKCIDWWIQYHIIPPCEWRASKAAEKCDCTNPLNCTCDPAQCKCEKCILNASKTAKRCQDSHKGCCCRKAD